MHTYLSCIDCSESEFIAIVMERNCVRSFLCITFVYIYNIYVYISFVLFSLPISLFCFGILASNGSGNSSGI